MIQRRVTIFCKLAIFWVVMVSGENFKVRAPKFCADYKQSKASWRRSKCHYRYHLYYAWAQNVITDGTFITLRSNYYTCAFYNMTSSVTWSKRFEYFSFLKYISRHKSTSFSCFSLQIFTLHYPWVIIILFSKQKQTKTEPETFETFVKSFFKLITKSVY